MTNHWVDIKNTNLVACIGGNPDEAHPAATRWINEARYGANSAKLLVVDPRKTRWATKADTYLQIRPGTDIAFFMGVLNYYFSRVTDPDGADSGTYKAALHKEKASRSFWKDDVSGKLAIPEWPKWTDASFRVNNADWTLAGDYEREASPSGGVSALPVRSMSGSNLVLEPGSGNPTVWQALKSRASYYTSAVVANICGCTATDFETAAKLICDNSWVAGTSHVATVLYAMGLTQHTKGSQNVRGVALMQTVLGNTGRAGGGINAERGIHNVQGSTDMGLLPNSLPGYMGPGLPTASGTATLNTYMDKLFGNPWTAMGSGAPSGSTSAYVGLQQRGFANTLHWWFKQGSDPYNGLQANFDLLATPQINGGHTGYNHRNMFRNAQAGTLKTMVIWGQNPHQTDANTARVREGLKNLDYLVVVEAFLSETADNDRKANAPTYLLPTAFFPEKAGSSTNSGRWIQWRDQAIRPKGKCKSDMQILLELVYALDEKSAFSWVPSHTYANNWGTQYGFTPSIPFEDTSSWTVAAGTADTVAQNAYAELCNNNQWTPAGADTRGWGALWIYKGAWDTAITSGTSASAWWNAPNLAKSRNPYDVKCTDGSTSTLGLYGRWCWNWIVNRRVFYNNGTVTGDIADTMVAPDVVARLWVHTTAPTVGPSGGSTAGAVQYAYTYRAYNTLKGNATGSQNVHFPRHVEAVESLRSDLDQFSTWGSGAVDTTGVEYATNGIYSGQHLPLILTTFRDINHFQGGQMTRNVPYLVELSPAATIEINTGNANAYGISTGDWVEIKTARSIYAASQGWISSEWIGDFKAVVKNGTPQTGVVGVPFHWGGKGLATGPTANLLCIDALDSNTAMQETKVSVCEIRKKP